MRYLKWISALTIIAMLFAMLPATVAEDEIIIDPVEVDGEALEIEMDDVEVLEPDDDSTLALEDATIELDGLENDLLISESEEPTVVPAAANASGDFVIDEEGTLTKYNGFEKNIVIPDGVKSIGYGVFRDYDIETVVIPEGVTSIESSAFYECDKLKSVSLPDSLNFIESSAFSDCKCLTSISIPKKVTSLGWYAFSGCSNLTNVQLSGKIEALTDGEFSNTGLKDLDFLKGTGIKEISGSAFGSCENFQSITIPDSVTTIGDYAFSDCTNLESVTIPAGITTIDRSAFNNSNNVVIRGTAGTYAERFANGVGIPFNAPVVTFDKKIYYDWDEEDTEYIEEIILYINHSYTLKAIQKPADLARELTWSSSDANVVTVDQNGTIQGIAQGTATITAATADGKGKAAKIKVLVPEPSQIEMYTYDDAIILGQTTNIEAYADTPYQYDTKVEMPITWSSSDSSVISIETTSGTSATLKGNKLGKATITASTPDGGTASKELEVIRPELDYITLNKTKANLGIKEKLALKVSLVPAEATTTLKWKSSNPKVAAVTKKGVVVGRKVGKAVITVTAANGYSAEATITVKAAPDSVTLSKSGTVTLKRGKTLKLKATLPKKTASALTWKSSRPKVASVDQKGVVRALKKGTAVITVKTFNGKTAKVTIKVK